MKSFCSDHQTWLHRVPAGWKLLSFALVSPMVFQVESMAVLAMTCLGASAAFLSLGRATHGVRRMCLWMLMAAGLVASFHLWMGQADVGARSALRLVTVGLFGWALTVSTRQGDMLDVLERVCRPFERWGWRSDALTLRLALMLTFVGHFVATWQQLDDAHRLRVGRSGGFRLLGPLTIQMLLAARRVADTLHVRLKW